MRLSNRGFGKALPETERFLGLFSLSEYSGAKYLLNGVPLFPSHGFFKLLHEPSND